MSVQEELQSTTDRINSIQNMLAVKNLPLGARNDLNNSLTQLANRKAELQNQIAHGRG